MNPDIDRYYDLAFADIVKTIGADSKTSLLDAGCGFCHHTVRLARSDAQITAVDFSPAALVEAEATLKRTNLTEQVKLEQADLTKLSFPDQSFDAVVCWGVLMHIPELESALQELVRVLKPGGILVLSENNMKSLDVRVRERMIDFAKKVVGRYRERRTVTPRGIEVWRDERSGGLMVRKSNIEFLVSFLGSKRVRLFEQTAGQFSESYTNIPFRLGKRTIYALNEFYFSRKLSPSLALSNILYFRKDGSNH